MAIEIKVPRLGWSMEEGTFSGWLKKDGERVNSGDRLFALEGDKATEEIESLDGGTLRIPSGAPQPGQMVRVGQLLGYLVAEGEAMPAGAAPVAGSSTTSAGTGNSTARETAGTKGDKETSPAERSAVPVTPRARRVAGEIGVDVSNVTGTGKGGRIRERDVRNASASAPIGVSPDAIETIPVTGLRRTIAARMLHSHQHTAAVTLTSRLDATELVALRRGFQAAGKASPVPSYTDIVAKVVARALRNHPMLAARWEGERLVRAKTINIGIAVDTERGLMVPVIRDVPGLTLSELARRSHELIASARAGGIKAADLEGGVFTITNLGAFGIDAFTPIINEPEVAILGMGEIRTQVVVLEDGSFAAREQMMLSLTFDHRIVDGAPAARFLKAVREGIEDLSSDFGADPKAIE